MQTPEEFMREYLAARAAEEARELENRMPFRRKYFTEGCIWESRKGAMEGILSQVIESVEGSKNDVRVITRGKQQASWPRRLRYCLKRNGEAWLIQDVDLECESCLLMGAIRPECPACGGTGWYDLELMKRFTEGLPNRPWNPPDSDG